MKHSFQLIDFIAFKKVSSLLAGNYKTSFHGSGMEFAGIREYNLGDNASDIDWRATARTGKTYIKKYEEDRERKVLFLIDTGSSMRFGNGERLKEETLADIFSLLLFSSAQNNDPIGTCFFSDRVERIYKTEKGMTHVQSIYDHLAVSFIKDNRDESSLPNLFEYLCQKRTRNHLIFILSDSMEFPKEEYFRSIAEQNDCIFIHIFDTFENTLEGGSVHITTPISDIFVDTSDLKKHENYILNRTIDLDVFQNKVTKLGGAYLSLDESKNIYKELYLFFKKRQSRGL